MNDIGSIYYSQNAVKLLERYELWAFGRTLDRHTRESMIKAPASFKAPTFFSGSFPGCDRHNEYIERWSAFRAALGAHSHGEEMTPEDRRAVSTVDRFIQDQRWENTKTAEARFWMQYGEKSEGKGFKIGGVALMVGAVIISIPLTIVAVWLVPVVMVVAGVIALFQSKAPKS